MITTRPLDLIHKLNTYDLSDIARVYCPASKKYYYIWGTEYHRKTDYPRKTYHINFFVVAYKDNYCVLPTYGDLLRSIIHNVVDLSTPHTIRIIEYETDRLFDIIQ